MIRTEALRTYCVDAIMHNPVIDICVCCGKKATLTTEHVIPKTLFPKPLPSNMITVGTCYRCNNGKSKEDAYLRDLLLADMAAEASDVAQQLRNSKLKRSVQRNSSEIAKAAMQRAYRKRLYSPGGIYVGSPVVVPVDEQRVRAIFEKIVRCLYYYITKVCIPTDYQFYLTRIDIFHTAKVWSQMRQLEAPSIEIRPDVFVCHYDLDPDLLGGSSWLILFYNAILFGVRTLPPGGESMASDPSSGLILPAFGTEAGNP